MLNTWVRLINFTLYFSIFFEHLVLSMLTVIERESLGNKTSLSNVQTYLQLPAPIILIDFILLLTSTDWFSSACENSGAKIIILFVYSILWLSTSVTPYFSTSTIPFSLFFSIAAMISYLILNVFSICGFFKSGVLKHK